MVGGMIMIVVGVMAMGNLWVVVHCSQSIALSLFWWICEFSLMVFNRLFKFKVQITFL